MSYLKEQEQDNQNQEQDDSVDVGGKRRHRKFVRHNKTKSNKNTIIVGKVYADWCGHCQMLKPEWSKMKKHIYSKKGKKRVVFVEIEEKQIESKLRPLEMEHGVKVNINGYPTLFRISGGKLVYYTGNRQSNEMSNWYLRGGDSEDNLNQENDEHMPEMLQDQQGGKRWRPHGTRIHRNRFKRLHRTKRFYQQHKGPRKSFEKKTPGFLDFLFGK